MSDGSTKALATLPKEVIRAKSASDDRKRLEYLASRLEIKETPTEDAARALDALGSKQLQASQRHLAFVRSKSNKRIVERQVEARMRVDAHRRHQAEQLAAQRQALEARLTGAKARHEESRQQELTRLSTRAASAPRIVSRAAQQGVNRVRTLESWLPQESDRWMGLLRSGEKPLGHAPAASGSSGDEEEQIGRQQQHARFTREQQALERYFHNMESRARSTHAFRTQRQMGQQANLHRILSGQDAEMELMRQRAREQDARDATRRAQRRAEIDDQRRQARHSSLQRQALVVSSNAAVLTKESWQPQESDLWSYGLRGSLYAVDPSILGGST